MSHLMLEFNWKICFSVSWKSALPFLTFGWLKTWTRAQPKPTVQSICSFLVLWQSDIFFLRYSKFNIWSWKFNIKIVAKVKICGHIWGLAFTQHFVFCFLAIGTFFSEIWQFHYLILKIQGPGHGQSQTWWPQLRPGVQSIFSFFISWQSNHLFFPKIAPIQYLTLKMQGQGHVLVWYFVATGPFFPQI